MTALPETSRPPHPRPWDLALPEPVIGSERFTAVAYELLPLLRRHHAEAGLEQEAIPLDPDWDKLFVLDLAGIIRLTTIRAEGLLIGYAISQVSTPLWHAGTKAAHLEGIYLDPLYRVGWTGFHLLKEHVNGLREDGVRVIKSEAPARMDHGRLAILFQRLGMREIERVYYMLLEPSS